ncbi:MAG: DUF4149 domain-containing protein [Acidobacteriota bacterium]
MAAVVEQVIRFSLAIWVGGTLVAVMAAPVLFRGIPSRDLAGDLFGEILRRFEAVKHALSLALVTGVFLELERQGKLERAGVASGIAIFLAVASNVYLSMVLRPRMKYFRRKVGSFDAAEAGNPWKAKFDRLHRRSTRVLVLGWIAAAAALALRP